MSTTNLEYLLAPTSVAVIGASNRPRSIGATVMRNLLLGGFAGPILPVNPKQQAVAGILAYPDVASLPKAPDLAVICTPPASVPGLIEALGARGTKAAVVLTAGIAGARGAQGESLERAMLEAARSHRLRILGPNCVGLVVPGIGLNASFAHAMVAPGHIAFVSQSGALVTAILDVARSKGVGFSHFISMGDSADVDFGDVLDFLSVDPATQSILLYVESLRSVRKFMSAARAAARNKPVLVLKAGRAPEGAKAAASHTGALAGADDVYDAAIRRAGMLRVFSIEELFDAVETLARAREIDGEGLTIMTNGGGAGVMAADALALGGGQLLPLAEETRRKLDQVLPRTWSHANPVDIIGDAPPERYAETLRLLLDDPHSGAILFLHAPTAIVPSGEVAAAVAPLAKAASRTVLACWLGGDAVTDARRQFAAAGIPAYDTPEQAVRAFLQIAEYRRNQRLLLEIPPSIPADFKPDGARVRALVREILAGGRSLLTETEAKTCLSAYGIPVVETRIARTAQDAADTAAQLGFPVAIKILSPDITHKSDVGGVVLDLQTPDEVRNATEAIRRRVAEVKPQAEIRGFSVQPMARRPRAVELIVGAATDPTFGPVILFGQGGVAVEVLADRAIGLPPLNLRLAKELVSRTRVSRLLRGYRDRAPADMDALCLAIVRVSQLVADIAEIAEIDINPLLADQDGVIALDARIRVAAATRTGAERLAIRPYPKELEERMDWNGRQVLVRPVRPEDASAYCELLCSYGDERMPLCGHSVGRHLPASQLARYTQIDYDREMVFVVTAARPQGTEIFGSIHIRADQANGGATFAVAVRAQNQGERLESLLLANMIAYGRGRGFGRLVGTVPAHRTELISAARDLGFSITPRAGDQVQVRLVLAGATAATDATRPEARMEVTT